MVFPIRKQPRLNNFDYSSSGAYFVTICSYEKNHLFGEINQGVVVYSTVGDIACKEIYVTNELRDNIEITKFVVMPNHIHMIIEIVGTRRAVSGNEQYEAFSKPTCQSIPTVIRAYKSAVSKKAHESFSIDVPTNGHGTPCPYGRIWQPRFHDRIIRNEQEYRKIWDYIDTNPERWESDCFYY